MNQTDSAHAWWSRLRHQGLLLSPVVMLERYPTAPPAAHFSAMNRLRDAQNRFYSKVDRTREGEDRNQAAILDFVDAVLENFVGHTGERIARQHSIPDNVTAVVRIGTRSETIRPHRVIFADEAGSTPALLVMADTSPHVGRGRGRTAYSRFLELLRGTGHRLGLLTNGEQFRLIYAGLDFESWCEWESERWFDDGEGTEELGGLRQLLSPESLKPVRSGVSGLLDAVEESRKRQADLSSVLRENVRQAVELLLEEVSTANRNNADLFTALMRRDDDRQLTDTEAHEALLQATVRVVMRLVVCLFAESRQLLPVNDPIFSQSYGVRSLYELLEEVTRYEGGTHALFNRQTAWPRLMALFRLIHGGSAHGAFPLRPYGGVLFRPGDAKSADSVARALHILEHDVTVGDATIYYVLRKLLRGPLPVIKGKSKTFVEGPVDYTDLRTEFIGLIYEGLLDYRVKRTDEQFGPQVFLNIGREPVLPLKRLEDMLDKDKKGLKELLTKLRKEKVKAAAPAEEVADEEKETEDEEDDSEDEGKEDAEVQVEIEALDVERGGDYLDAVTAAKCWAKEAVVVAGLVRNKRKNESGSEYEKEVEAESNKLIKKDSFGQLMVKAVGEFYLVRAGNTRKGTGTFYTRPQLAVPTTHRTLEPLCYVKAEHATLIPKEPEVILDLKVCDPACGSASFLVAALHYLTDALYKSLVYHRQLDDPEQSKQLTLPYGRPRTNGESDRLVPFPPNDPQRGHTFEDRVKALLRRHVVERCIYGVDINSLAVEFARVSLWVETLDPELPFSFLDHKIKVGNSLVGCWLDRVEDYPLNAWMREGGDGDDGPRTDRIESMLKGPKEPHTTKKGKKTLRRSGDGRVKREMREVIESRFSQQPHLFREEATTAESVVAAAGTEYETLHDLPISDPEERETYYRQHVEQSESIRTLKAAMDEWCALWFWPADEESLSSVPTPLSFHQHAADKIAVVERLTDEMKFFHWEIEYPDVFTPESSGFDAMIGNPPREVMKSNSHEFFTEYDPLYRTYGKQAALERQGELFISVAGLRDNWNEYNGRFKAMANWAKNVQEPFDLTLSRRKDGEVLAKQWAAHRAQRPCFADRHHPFRLQGSADLNLYKLFAECFWTLTKNSGRVGVILPTGIYSDLGTKALREELLFRGSIDLLYAFQNEKRVFSAAHHAGKQVSLMASKGGITKSFKARFRMGVGDSPYAHEIPDDILNRDNLAMSFTPEDIRFFSPNTLSLVELKSERDLTIFRTVYENSFRVGDSRASLGIKYAREFDMTNDSKLFPPLEKWLQKGFHADDFGRFIGPDGEAAVPFFEGRMVGQLDCSHQGWVRGKGRTAVWRPIPFDNKRIEPQFLMALETLRSWPKANLGFKVSMMDITASTNSRSMIANATSFFPFGHSAPTLSVAKGDPKKTLYCSSVLNSFAFDFAARPRVSGVHFTLFILEECPLPKHSSQVETDIGHLATRAARLSLLHRRFAPEWLRLKTVCTELADSEWKHWWAVTEADRIRLRVEIDALVADLYALAPDDFDWIVRDDRSDSKGFWRVDDDLPFAERLTGLAAAAFRALKEGRWSAETAAELSNDEFFDILGKPELTNASAAKAKGLSGPLILKRDGCHEWKPENFSEDDPRHGWTWDHCYQDAVTLLGSEEAVEAYLNDEPKEPAETNGEPDESTEGEDAPFQLSNKPKKAKQPKMF